MSSLSATYNVYTGSFVLPVTESEFHELFFKFGPGNFRVRYRKMDENNQFFHNWLEPQICNNAQEFFNYCLFNVPPEIAATPDIFSIEIQKEENNNGMVP